MPAPLRRVAVPGKKPLLLGEAVANRGEIPARESPEMQGCRNQFAK